MLRSFQRARGLVAAMLAFGGLCLSACDHDWDVYLPVGGNQTSVGGAGAGTGTGTATGTGGQGGIVVEGSCPAPQGGNDTPLVLVPTSSYTATCIDAFEVTRGQYEAWLGTSPATDSADRPAACGFNSTFLPIASWPPNGVQLNVPVAFVDWCDAEAFCSDQDKRLCGAIDGGGAVPFASFNNANVCEWFNACTDRGNRTFPYGSSYDSTACTGATTAPASVGTMTGCRGAYLVYDLSGNVAEWVNSCSADVGEDDLCRIRGGGYNNYDNDLACAADSTRARDDPSIAIGFRCCADPILP